MNEAERRRLRAVIELEQSIDSLGRLADYYGDSGDIKQASDLCDFLVILMGLRLGLAS